MKISLLKHLGNVLLGFSIAAFGIEQLLYGHLLLAFFPVKITPSKQLYVCITIGILYIFAALPVWFSSRNSILKLLPLTLFLAPLLFFHLPILLHNPSNGSKWTVCFELVSLAFGTAISVYLPDDFSGITKLTKVNLQKVCIIFFGLSLFVFSVLHFVYSAYISTLIPIWIPFHLFWAYFFGCAFLATSLSIISNKYSRISTFALSLMFLLWVFVLHLPRVIVNPIEAEITSLFVALGMSGVSMLFSFYSRRSAQFSVHAIL